MNRLGVITDYAGGAISSCKANGVYISKVDKDSDRVPLLNLGDIAETIAELQLCAGSHVGVS